MVRPGQLEALKQHREKAVVQLQDMLDVPTPSSKSGKRAWLTDVDRMRRMVADFDRLIASCEKGPPKPPRPRVTKTEEPTDIVVLGRIPKGRRAELRVALASWKGRRTVDVRVWSIPKGESDYRPTRRGVSLDASKLPLIIEGLKAAMQHV